MLKKLFGDANQKYIKKLGSLIQDINKLEPKFEAFKNADFAKKTQELKKQDINKILSEAFALAREAAKQTINQRPFDTQIMTGIVLHRGEIAEMKTGEGKTLAAVMPAYLNALFSPVHIITVNDYLAQRDANWMGPIFNLLGLSVGCTTHESAFVFNPKTDPDRDEVSIEHENLKKVSRKEAYACDILYGTNNEFGFDYLRDNMASNQKQIVQRELGFAIIDEVDSILIDEARTPLIISAPDQESTNLYLQFTRLVPQLDKDKDFEIDKKLKTVHLTDSGMTKTTKLIGIDIWQTNNIKLSHQLEQALRAHALFNRDKDYVVRENQIIIVDEFTGRLMPGRRYSGGLHQAIEAKESVPIMPESKTLASITFQNYFRLYKKLSGMTGTAITSAEEFDKVYSLDVIAMPTNKPLIRQDKSDLIFKSENGKFKAITQEIKKQHAKGQPILIGTVSIEKNEKLSKFLKQEGIAHEILNAKNHEQEAEIIAKAGEKNAVTVATNMAGRGVDIKLGSGVKKLGGLHVIGTERHEARRIDNQLRGRSGRQGDPGSSQFFVSLEDSLMQIFGSNKVQFMMKKFKLPEDQPIQHKLISRGLENAQSQIEGHNFDIRKHLLDYDDVLNKQRETIYKKRRETKDGVKKRIIDILWMEHLDTMEYLRQSVRLRAYGQRDPLIEYKKEGYNLFQNLLTNIDSQTQNAKSQIKKIQHEIKFKDTGRNDKCPCGSGKKYKKCCLLKA